MPLVRCVCHLRERCSACLFNLPLYSFCFSKSTPPAAGPVGWTGRELEFFIQKTNQRLFRRRSDMEPQSVGGTRIVPTDGAAQKRACAGASRPRLRRRPTRPPRLDGSAAPR